MSIVVGRYVAQSAARAAITASTSRPSPRGPISRNRSRARRRPRPASSSRRTAPCRRAEQDVVVADVGVDQGVARATTVGEAGGQRRGLVEVREVRPGGGDVVPVRRPGRRARRRRCRGPGRRRGVSSSATTSSASRRGVEVGLPPGPARRAAPRRTRSRARPSRRPSIHSSRGRGHAGGQGPELAGLLAVGVGEHPLGLRRGRLDEVLRAVRAGEHRGEAGREAPALRDGVDHGRPAVLARPGRARAGAGAASSAVARCGRAGSWWGWRSPGHPSRTAAHGREAISATRPAGARRRR